VGRTASVNTLGRRNFDPARKLTMAPRSFQNVIQTKRQSQWLRGLISVGLQPLAC